MLYWKTRDSKIPLEEFAAGDGGGAGNDYDITVEQSYDATSPNAQAGTAVAQAVAGLEAQIDQKYGGALQYKGSKENYAALPKTDNKKGDVWNVNDTDANYVWDGENWDKLSENLEGLVTKDELNTLQASFDTHKSNGDTDAKHLNSKQYSDFQRMELFTKEEVKGYIGDALNDKIQTGDLVTSSSLQTELNKVEQTVQKNVTDAVSGTVSSSYVSNTDFEAYKNSQSSLFGQYIKCSTHTDLKVYTTSSSIPPMESRDSNVIYLVVDDFVSTGS